MPRIFKLEFRLRPQFIPSFAFMFSGILLLALRQGYGFLLFALGMIFWVVTYIISDKYGW